MSNNTLHRSYETVWLSDIHLGNRDCKAEFLDQFLQSLNCKQLFLVGDVVDLWALKKRSYWPESHQQVLRTLSQLSQSGTRVIYLPGNHDERLRDFIELELFGLEIYNDWEYETLTGKRLLVLHGDLFDSAVYCGPVQNWLGDIGYDLLMWMNRWFNRMRQTLGFPYFSLAGYIKARVKNANEAVKRYENAAIHEAKHRGLDGVVCGHIHVPNLMERDGILYINDGDWVENCTAIVEHRNGELEMLRFHGEVVQETRLELGDPSRAA